MYIKQNLTIIKHLYVTFSIVIVQEGPDTLDT